MTLEEFKRESAKAAFGMTKEEAHAKRICIDCKQPNPLTRCKTLAGVREYQITAMCEECWDKEFK